MRRFFWVLLIACLSCSSKPPTTAQKPVQLPAQPPPVLSYPVPLYLVYCKADDAGECMSREAIMQPLACNAQAITDAQDGKVKFKSDVPRGYIYSHWQCDFKSR